MCMLALSCCCERLLNYSLCTVRLCRRAHERRTQRYTYKKLETAQYRMAHYMLCVGPTGHVRMTTGYETLGMLPLWVVLVNLADVGMGCKTCQYGWHPNAQEHHVLPDGQGQETTRQVFRALVGHFKADPGFCEIAWQWSVARGHQSRRLESQDNVNARHCPRLRWQFCSPSVLMKPTCPTGGVGINRLSGQLWGHQCP